MKPTLCAISKYLKRATDESDAGPYRTDFMRDRDRILYSKPFRRLSKKTQVFLFTSDDHFRTRLTHSLEVSQIATTSAQVLSLDRDLTEAISLGHDLGHTPFGHSGERTLNLIMCNCDDLGGFSPNIENNKKGFKHNLQGIRLATELTSLYDNITGLNLSNYALWGIKNHTGDVWKKCEYSSKDNNGCFFCNIKPNIKNKKCENLNIDLNFYSKYFKFISQSCSDNPAWSFEGYLVGMSDEIAQRHHDIEDGLIAGIIEKDELISIIDSFLKSFFNREEKRFFEKTKKANSGYFIQGISRIIVGSLNRNLIENSIRNLRRFLKFYEIKKRDDFVSTYPKLEARSEISDDLGRLPICDIISYPSELQKLEKTFQEYLKDRILNSYHVQRMDGKASFILRQLAKAYLTNPQQLPDNYIRNFFVETSGLTENSIGDMRNWLSDNYFSHDKSFNHLLLRIICDLLSGMTDEFALIEHGRLYSSTETSNLRHY
jgi:dGTPase